MTISLSIPSNTLSALAPASDTDMRGRNDKALGTDLDSGVFARMACFGDLDSAYTV